MRHSMLFAVSLIALALHAHGVAGRQNEVGTTAAVNPIATGTPPGQAIRTLFIGTDVVFKERIATSKTGLTQILFLDGSSITVGPNADLTLDEFVYDPDTRSGNLVLSIAKGVFRLIGGRIGKTTGVTIQTPIAAVGVRGSITQGEVEADAVEVTFVAGEQMTVKACATGLTPGECVTRTIIRPEFTVKVTPDSFTVEKATVDEIAAQITQLESASGQDGGATEIPTNDQVADQGIDEGGSANDPPPTGPQAPAGTGTTTPDPAAAEDLGEQTTASQDAAAGGGGGGGAEITLPGVYSGRAMWPPGDFGEATCGDLDICTIGFTDGAVTAGKFTATLDGDPIELPIAPGDFAFAGVAVPGKPVESPIENPGVFGPADGPASGTGYLDPSEDFLFYEGTFDLTGDPAFLFAGIATPDAVFAAESSFRVDSYELRPDFRLESPIPFLRDEVASLFPSAAVSDYLVARAPSGTLADNSDTKTLWAALAIEGQDVDQKSLLVGAVGTLFPPPSVVSNSQALRGMVRLDASDKPIRLGDSVRTIPDGAGNHFFGDDLEFFVLDQSTVDDDIRSAIEEPFDLETTPAELYEFRHVAMKIDTPPGVGVERTARTLNGFAATLVRTRLMGDVFPDDLADDEPLAYALESGFSDTFNEDPPIPVDPLAISVETDPATNSVSAVFVMGNVGEGATDVEAFTFTFGGIGSPSSAFIDDQLFGTVESPDIPGFIVVNPDVPPFEDVVLEGLDLDTGRLGFASLMVTHDLVSTDSFLPAGVTFCECDYLTWGYWTSEFRFDDPGGDNEGRLERIHLGTWVVGELPDLVDIPTAGIATYSGHAIGNVFNSLDQYISVGNFENVWNFGTRAGVVSVTDFDGRDFAAAVTASVANPRGYVGQLEFTGGDPPIGFMDGQISGSFFAGGGDPVASTAGRFTIINDALAPTNYTAEVTFAATK